VAATKKQHPAKRYTNIGGVTMHGVFSSLLTCDFYSDILRTPRDFTTPLPQDSSADRPTLCTKIS
jgi:hypothetical protein